MPSHAVHRLLDSYFRHPLLNLLPLLLFTVLGGMYLTTIESMYRSDGFILVEDRTFLSSLTGVRGAEGGYETPATQMSRQLNSMLQTDAFITEVVERSGLADPTALSADDRQRLRSSIGSWEAGENLVRVWSRHEQPEVAHLLATATIDSLIEWQIDAEVEQSTAAEKFLAPLTEQYREEAAAAQAALEDYLQENPVPLEGDRPATQQIVVDRLTAEVSDASARYTDALAKEESARLATAQAEADVRNRLQLVDAPVMPTAPEGSLKTSIISLAAFLAAGGVLSLALVIVGAVLDQTVRFARDVRTQFDLEVLAALPDTSAWKLASGSPSGSPDG